MDSVARRKARVAAVSVASNTALVVMKVVVGLSIGSVSVISEAIHSLMDLLAAAIAYFAVRTSGKPADRRHQYGHGKVESVSGLVEALLIFTAAGWIVWEAAKRIMHGGPLEAAGWGVVVMLVSAAANMVVSRMLFKVGRETESIALMADAWHLRTDVWTSAGVMGALAVIWTARRFVPGVNLEWLDPAAAIGVALLILKAAYDLTGQAMRELMDRSLPVAEEKWISSVLARKGGGVRSFHDLKTRRAGGVRFIEFHIQVDPRMTVDEAHRIAGRLKQVIRTRFPRSVVSTHEEPYRGSMAGFGRQGHARRIGARKRGFRDAGASGRRGRGRRDGGGR